MIVKIHKSGRSFKGAGQYLTHDPDADSDERVAWTHTLNLAHDHVLSAIDEMYWTSENAELLKAEAGVRGGGRATENPVKHISLSWGPEESPTRDQMILASEEYLAHMGWSTHQSLIVAHDDKAYDHCHLLINAIHPENGRKLDENFEKVRSQEWALDYELRMGRVLCENRLINLTERDEGPTRPAWMAFKEREREFAREEDIQRAGVEAENPGENTPENIRAAEWRQLKELQRAERESWFAQGRLEFKELRTSVYREVRAEFREGWADYFHDLKAGGDAEALAARKAELIAGQTRVLEERRDDACAELRKERDGQYKELLVDQLRSRVGLQSRQEAGFDNSDFLDRLALGRPSDIRQEVRDTAGEITRPTVEPTRTATSPFAGWARDDDARMRSSVDAGAKIGEALGFSLISFAESLFDGFVGANPEPPKPVEEPPTAPPGRDLFEEAVKQARERKDREQAEEEWRARQRGAGGD